MARKVSTALANANDTISYLKKQIEKYKAKEKKQESLYETIAFITHSVSCWTDKYEMLYRDLGEGMFGPWSWFIKLAKEFEETNAHREWGMDDGEDYIDTLDAFIERKVNEKLGLDKPAKTVPNGKAKIQKRRANKKKVR